MRTSLSFFSLLFSFAIVFVVPRPVFSTEPVRPFEMGVTTPFDWSPDNADYTQTNTDPSNLNWQTYLRNLDAIRGRVEWVRIHSWMWLVLDPAQFDGDQPKSNDIIKNPRIWDRGVAVLKDAIFEAHQRGFKVQIASADLDHRISNRKNWRGALYYSFADIRTHYGKVMKALAQELAAADSWQLFNESNQFFYRDGVWDGLILDRRPGYLQEIVTLLAIARTEIKKNNPEAIVLSATYQPWEERNNPRATQDNRRRLQTYYDAVAPLVDEMSFNFYFEHERPLDEQATQDRLRQLRDQVAFMRARYGKSIFIGEYGVPVCHGLDDHGQARLLRVGLSEMAKLGVSTVMMYTLQDDPKAFQLGTDECQYNFGFINSRGKKRPAFEEILTKLLIW